MTINKEVSPTMDYLTQMKEISDYYKGRYEKAVALGISEGSKHYEAFKEIQLRYGATETAAECMTSRSMPCSVVR